MRSNVITIAIILTILAILGSFLFLQPIFSDIENRGLYDWDQHFFYHDSPRISLLTFNEFPLWNPYYCGGNLLLANPQSPFLTPFFALVLLFGATIGLKLQALTYLAAGLVGTFLVARHLGSKYLPSIFAAIVFMFSSWYVVRVVVGHTTFFPFALMPFAFLFYLKAAKTSSTKSIKWIIAAALTLTIMFLAGGIYPFYATAILLSLYSLFDSISKKKITPIVLVIAILVLAFLFGAVKFLPVVDFAYGLDVDKDTQYNSANIIFSSLLSRDHSLPEKDLQTGLDTIPEGREKEELIQQGRLPWGWHEYSAYIGIIPLLIAALALLKPKKNWKLLAAALFFFTLAIGNYLPIGLWQFLRELPFFSSLHGPSRFMIVFVFIIALLAAKSLSSIRIPSIDKKIKFGIIVLLCLVVTVDLIMISRPLLDKTFPLEPIEIRSSALGEPEFIQMLSSAPYLSQHPNLLQGIGTLNCYERLRLQVKARPQFLDGEPFEGFINNVYIAETNQYATLTHFSPERVEVRIPNIENDSTIVVNQNYFKGWKAQIEGKDQTNAVSYKGMLAAKVSAADSGKEVTFKFTSTSFKLGAIISILTIIAAIFFLIKPGKTEFVFKLIEKANSLVFRK
jgi:uncharacterized membrane protein YfhO